MFMAHYMKRIIVSILALFAITLVSFAQRYTKEEEKSIELAMEFVDNGNANKAIDIYKQLLKDHPKDGFLTYEMAYCYYAKQDFKTVIKLLEKVEKGTDVDGYTYALHGNSLDNLGKRQQAIEKYKEGLSKFPDFGQLYLELGTVYYSLDRLDEAVEAYTTGIKVDPSFTSNYYRISQLLCKSNEPVWGIIYGEIHELLSPNSRRSEELSEAIFEAYNHNMKFQSDTTFLLTLTTKKALAKEDGSYEIPFEVLFEYYSVAPEVAIAVQGNGSVDIKSLTESRRNLITNMFKDGQNQEYLYPIFKYQQRVLEAGHWEAYNMWLLRKGNEEEFSNWMEENREKLSAFANWYKENNFDPVDSGKL